MTSVSKGATADDMLPRVYVDEIRVRKSQLAVEPYREPGRGRGTRGRPLRPGPAGARPPRPRPAPRRDLRAALEDAACSSPRTRPPHATARPRRVDWHRLVLDEAQDVKNARRCRPAPSGASGPGTASRSPAPRSRTASPSSGRSWTCSTRASWAPPSGSGRASPCPSSGTGTPTPPSCCAASRAPPAAPGKDGSDDRPDLPDKIEITQHYRLTREQATLYRTIVDDMLEKIEDATGIARRGNVLAALTELKQICNHPALPARRLADRPPLRQAGAVGGDPRRAARGGRPAPCLHPVRRDGAAARPAPARRGSTRRSRSCTAASRGGGARASWSRAVSKDVVAARRCCWPRSRRAARAQPDGAKHVVHFDRWWNPAVEEQATDRAFRIGQRRTVQVHKFVLPRHASRSGSTR